MLYSLFERVFATVLFVLTLPILAIVALLIRLDSAGSPIFRQTRVGQSETTFTLYKLRTMKIGTINAGSHQVSDAQVTALGKQLRRFKLDELPQLWNVVRGDMRLVGPRPCLPTQYDVIEARRRSGVLHIKPGITGLAQVRNIDMSTPDKLAEADAEYARNRTAKGDLQLLATTFGGKGRGDAVKG